MIVDLTESNWPREFDLEIEPADIDLETQGARVKVPVHVKGAVEKHDAWFDVFGTINGEIEVDCSRCLESVKRPLGMSFNDRFVVSDGSGDESEREVSPDDLDLSALEGNTIDLTEVVREQILLDLPEQIFCSDDCKGLCPKCGANRNLIDCKCQDDEADPRWAALKNFRS